LVLGFASTIAQVVVLRELLVSFAGNELTIAATLTAWLLAVAAGSIASRHIAPGHRSSTAILFVAAGFALPLQVISLRLLHPAVTAFGEMIPPADMALVTLAGVFPAAAILGALFVALAREAARAGLGHPVATTYGYEAFGSAIAGAMLGLLFRGGFNPIAAVGLAGIVCLGCAAKLARTGASRLGGKVAPALVLGLGGLAVLATAPRIDLATRQAEWKPLRVVRTVDSQYGNIAVGRRDGTYDFFDSGMLAFTVPDAAYAEECAHIPLLHHPSPASVLVIGGAGSGVISEIAEHPSVKRIDFVELDPALVSAVEAFAPPGWLAGTDRVTVTAHLGDAREYVAAATQLFDVAIVGLGAPATLQVNRFYSAEFFLSLRRVLRDDGLVAIKIATPGAYVGQDLGSLVASLADALRAVFAHVIVLPGDYTHVLASPGLDLEAQTPLLGERLRTRGITTSFVNRYVLWDRLSPMRLAALDSVVARYDEGKPNSDMRPVSFAKTITFWEKHYRGGRVIARIAAWLDPTRYLLLLVAMGAAAVAVFALISRSPRAAVPRLAMLYSIGFVTMFTQVLAIVGLQIVTGYIYGRIAAMIAAFMVGLGAASLALARRRADADENPRWHPSDLILIAPPLAAVGAIKVWQAVPRALPGYLPTLVFAGVALLAGVSGGAIFARASRPATADPNPADRGGALAYSLDLTGASVAGLTTGVLAIPALGLAPAAYAATGYALIALALAAIWTVCSPGPRPR
jgi:spermidine synthase